MSDNSTDICDSLAIPFLNGRSLMYPDSKSVVIITELSLKMHSTCPEPPEYPDSPPHIALRAERALWHG